MDSNISNQASTSIEKDKSIAEYLELQRQTMIDSRHRIAQKSHQTFALMNVIASVVVGSHVALIPLGEVKLYMVISLIVFGLLYMVVADQYIGIAYPTVYYGGVMKWDLESIRSWRTIPEDKYYPQLIAQYNVLCNNNRDVLMQKADALESMLRVLRLSLIVVFVEVLLVVAIAAK